MKLQRVEPVMYKAFINIEQLEQFNREGIHLIELGVEVPY